MADESVTIKPDEITLGRVSVSRVYEDEYGKNTITPAEYTETKRGKDMEATRLALLVEGVRSEKAIPDGVILEGLLKSSPDGSKNMEIDIGGNDKGVYVVQSDGKRVPIKMSEADRDAILETAKTVAFDESIDWSNVSNLVSQFKAAVINQQQKSNSR